MWLMLISQFNWKFKRNFSVSHCEKNRIHIHCVSLGILFHCVPLALCGKRGLFLWGYPGFCNFVCFHLNVSIKCFFKDTMNMCKVRNNLVHAFLLFQNPYIQFQSCITKWRQTFIRWNFSFTFILGQGFWTVKERKGRKWYFQIIHEKYPDDVF